MSRNDITMDSIRSRGPSEAYDQGYEAIFGKKTKPPTLQVCTHPNCDNPHCVGFDTFVQLGVVQE
jgi:hypothetical protein